MRQMLELVTGPSVQPLTTDEAKAHLRVDHTTDDSLIESLIKAATQTAERFHVGLLSREWVSD